MAKEVINPTIWKGSRNRFGYVVLGAETLEVFSDTWRRRLGCVDVIRGRGQKRGWQESKEGGGEEKGLMIMVVVVDRRAVSYHGF